MRTPIALLILALLMLWLIRTAWVAHKRRRDRGGLSTWQRYNLDILVRVLRGERIADIFTPEIRYRVQGNRGQYMLNQNWTANIPQVVRVSQPEPEQVVADEPIAPLTIQTVPLIPLASSKSEQP